MDNFDYADDRFCPIVGNVIEADDCFDVFAIAEDGAPLWTADKRFTSVNDFKKICKNCKYYGKC